MRARPVGVRRSVGRESFAGAGRKVSAAVAVDDSVAPVWRCGERCRGTDGILGGGRISRV